MKTSHLNTVKIAFVVGLFMILQACKPLPGSWKNDKIADGKRDDFHKLNKEALRYLKANDGKSLQIQLFSKAMNEGHNDRQIGLISNRLTDNEFDLLDEFYVVHKYKDTDTVAAVGGDVNRYALMAPCVNQEMYFAFFVPKKSDNKYMLTLVYSKFSYGWKITEMGLSPYTINGKTAPELYALARSQYDKKEMQAAIDNVSLAVTCFKPSQYWMYPDEASAGQLYTTLHQEVTNQYHYPMVLKLATGPMILRVYSKTGDDGGTYPLIYYMTHFPLKDSTEVKKENMEIRGVVASLMPGISENNKYIYYSAFNKQPTGYETVDHFDMVDKVKK
jgi:hypothetical protein